MGDYWDKLRKHEPFVNAWMSGKDYVQNTKPGERNAWGMFGAGAEGFIQAISEGQLGLEGPQLDEGATQGVDDLTNRMKGYEDLYGSQAAQMWQNQLQSRAQQNQLSQMLMDQANGIGPSLAQAQLQSGTDRNMQQAAALMGAQRGMNSGAAMRQLAMQRAGIGQEAAQQSGMLRLTEQLKAREQLGTVLGQMRGGDLASQEAQNKMLADMVANGLTLEQAKLKLAWMQAQQAQANRGALLNSIGNAVSHGAMGNSGLGQGSTGTSGAGGGLDGAGG